MTLSKRLRKVGSHLGDAIAGYRDDNFLRSAKGLSETATVVLDAADQIDEAANEIERLRAERDGLQKLLDDKSYIRCLADYNRGHLSHHNYLDATRRRALERQK